MADHEIAYKSGAKASDDEAKRAGSVPRNGDGAHTRENFLLAGQRHVDDCVHVRPALSPSGQPPDEVASARRRAQYGPAAMFNAVRPAEKYACTGCGPDGNCGTGMVGMDVGQKNGRKSASVRTHFMEDSGGAGAESASTRAS